MNQISITTVRCARCPKKFEVINIETKTEFVCPHCGGKHVKLNGQWFDAMVLKIRKDETGSQLDGF